MKYNHIFWGCFVVLIAACSIFHPKDHNKSLIKVSPPGAVQIGENLFADEQEVGTIDYREFMWWTRRVFGVDSEEYKTILPDTTVWFNQKYKNHLHESYMNHPSYNDYPVVGVSLGQAKKYTKWRTDRVAEMLLVRRKSIPPNPHQNPENYFTIEGYANGTYENIHKREDILTPIYRMPSTEEWEYFARGSSNFRYGIDSLSKENKKVQRNYGGHLFCTNDYVNSADNHWFDEESDEMQIQQLTVPIRSFAENIFGIKGIVGNVSEMVLEEGISKGGSWRDSIQHIEISKNFIFEKPNEYTGFRNICSWEWVEMEQ